MGRFAGKMFEFMGQNLKFEYDVWRKVLFYEYHWHCSLLFSLFPQYTLLKLLTALLLERSLIFVHDNLSVVSSVVLALKLLLRPFQWCFLLAPVLPNKLLDQIDQPFPILVGITRKDFDNIDSIFEEDFNSSSSFEVADYMQTEEFLNRSWVFLDC